MSTTTTAPSSSPIADNAISISNNLVELAQAAEADPVVKAALQAQFDSISHSPLVLALVPIVATWLTQKHITADNQVLALGIGAAIAGIGYGFQWISMKLRKPVTTTTTGISA